MAQASTPPLVRSVRVPEEVRALCTLARIDYADATVVEVDRPGDRTAEQWMRAVFDEPPWTLRLRLWSAWRMLGLRLGSPCPGERILGWHVERATPDTILLGARSNIGMPAQLLLVRRSESLLLDTFVRQDNALARAVWAAIEPLHRRTVPDVLGRMVRQTDAGGSTCSLLRARILAAGSSPSDRRVGSGSAASSLDGSP